MLFRRKQTEMPDTLPAAALKKEPVHVEVHDEDATATVAGLDQRYVVCPSNLRLPLLFTWLKKNMKKKVMVFFSTFTSVKFHGKLFNHLGLPVTIISWNMLDGKLTKQSRRELCNATSGIILCKDDVCGRGLDIPAVDGIVQFDPPFDREEYVRRVGLLARGEGGTGSAVLFLRPEEVEFVPYLEKAGLTLKETTFSLSEMENIQAELEKLITDNSPLQLLAVKAFKAYLHLYRNPSLKDIFLVNTLDLQNVSKGFGLSETPSVDYYGKSLQNAQSTKPGGGGEFASVNEKEPQQQMKAKIHQDRNKFKKDQPQLSQ